MKIAEAWEAASRRQISRGQANRVLDEIFNVEGASGVTVEAYVREWLQEVKGSVSASTFSTYSNGVNHFLKAMGDRAASPLLHISRADLSRYKQTLTTGHPTTGNARLKLLRMIFKSAREAGHHFDDPFVGLKLLKASRDEETARRPFTIPELQVLLEAADPEWRSLILFGVATGQRLGDLATLRWSQVDLSRNEVSLTTKKTGRRMIIPINSRLAEHLTSLPSADDPAAFIHPRAAGLVAGARGKVSTVSRHFAELLESVGLRSTEPGSEEVGHGSTGKGRSGRRKQCALSFHCLRHTARSFLEAAGVPLGTAMHLLGHSDTGSSLHYVTADIEAVRKASEHLKF